MERRNGQVMPKPEVNKPRATGTVVSPEYVFVRLGEEQRVKVNVPMSSETLRVLGSLQKLNNLK